MRFSLPRAAAAALLGSTLFVAGGCASGEKFPASPVPAPLTDLQAMRLSQMHLDEEQAPTPRYVASVLPTGDGYMVDWHTAMDATRKPPVESRLVLVKFDGEVREITFREGK